MTFYYIYLSLCSCLNSIKFVSIWSKQILVVFSNTCKHFVVSWVHIISYVYHLISHSLFYTTFNYSYGIACPGLGLMQEHPIMICQCTEQSGYVVEPLNQSTLISDF